jgi:hypothetical protein
MQPTILIFFKRRIAETPRTRKGFGGPGIR